MRLEKKTHFFFKLTPLFPKTPQHLRFALSDIFNKIKYIFLLCGNQFALMFYDQK